MSTNTPTLLSRIVKATATSATAGIFLAGTAFAAPPTPDVSGLKVLVDGTPLPMAGAAVTHGDGSALALTVSTEPLTCKDYADFGRMLATGERYFDVEFKPLLQADGTVNWRVESLQMDMQRPASDTDLSGLRLLDTAPTAPARFELNLSTALEASDFFKKPEVKLELQGGGVAHMCKRAPLHEVKSRPQKKLKLTVAGREFPVLGATLSPEGLVRISTSPTSCGGSNGEDIYIEFNTVANDIEWDSTDTKYHPVYAKGDMLEMQYNLNVPGVATAPKTPGDEGYLVIAVGTGKATRKVKLDGKFAIGDLPVVISGELEVLGCEP